MGVLLVILAFLLCASEGWSIPERGVRGLGCALSEGESGAALGTGRATFNGTGARTSFTNRRGGRWLCKRYAKRLLTVWMQEDRVVS